MIFELNYTNFKRKEKLKTVEMPLLDHIYKPDYVPPNTKFTPILLVSSKPRQCVKSVLSRMRRMHDFPPADTTATPCSLGINICEFPTVFELRGSLV